MKKTILLGFVLFFGMWAAALAQKSGNRLEGIWQFCQVVNKDNGEKVLACSPIWKILYSDGKFSQFMLMYKDGECALTHCGTYEVVSDSVYIEHIMQHAVDRELVGTDTKLNYRFVNDDMVEFSFRLQGRNDEFNEVWKRVRLFKQSQK